MPFSGAKRAVSRFFKRLTQKNMLIGNRVPMLLQVKQGSASMQHCPARHTNRANRSTGNMGASKRSSIAHKLIHVGCTYFCVSQSSYRVKPLIIRKKEDNIGS